MGISSGGKIRLLYVPLTHRGTTDYLLTGALRGCEWPDYSSILYLAPNPSKAREAQRRFHRIVKHPYIPPRFLTIMQLAMDLYSRELPGRRLPRVLTPLVISGLSGQGIGYAKVISDLLGELKQHSPLTVLDKIHQDLTAIFAELGMPEDARRTLDSALAVFSSYEKVLTASGYLDDDDILARACTTAEGCAPLCSVLLVDGFTHMTAAELGMITALAHNARSAAITCPSAEDGGPPRGYAVELIARCRATEELLAPSAPREATYVGYAGAEEEFEGIARHIRSRYAARGHIIGDRISVAAPSLEERLPLAMRVFRRYGIPFASAGGTSALLMPGMRDIFSLLDAVADDFPRLAFTSFLNSPFFPGLDDAVRSHVPSLSLRSGIIKGRSSWQNLAKTCDDRDTARRISEDLSSLFGRLDALACMREGCEGPAFATAVEDLLQEFGFEAGDETREELRKAMELAGRLHDLPGGPLPLKRHVEHLRHILRSSKLRPGDAPVQLMDFGDTRGLEPDILYLCGLKDGALPSRPPVDLVLPDSVRAAYGLLTFKGHLARQKLDFLRLCGASAEIHLSYPAVEGDKVNLPSAFLPLGGERSEQVFGIFSEAELQTRKGRGSLADSISEIRIDGRTLDRITRRELAMPLRVTDIDAFRRCPRRFFMERVLGLEASEVAEYEVEARLLGILVHKIMERLLQSPLDSPEAARESACLIMSEVLEKAPIEPYWKRLLTATFLEMLPAIIRQETALRAEGFLPDQLEMSVIEQVRPGITLKGKVDRVDRRDALFRVIDYKTGTADVGSAIIRKGKNLQLPLYAAMLGARGMEVERAGIYSLREIGVQWIPTKRDKFALADYVDASLEFLDQVVAEMRAGRFTAAPAEEFICAACPEAPFCPYVHARRGAPDA